MGLHLCNAEKPMAHDAAILVCLVTMDLDPPYGYESFWMVLLVICNIILLGDHGFGYIECLDGFNDYMQMWNLVMHG